jgi:hypothetical protein
MAKIKTRATNEDVTTFLDSGRRLGDPLHQEKPTTNQSFAPVVFVYDWPADPLLGDLGAHTTGKGCLYIKRLSDIDERVLEQLIRNAWERAQ